MHSDTQSRTVVYKGIHFTDLIARNTNIGGKIIDISFRKNNDELLVQVTTDFADGLTIVKDLLLYKDDLLLTWDVVFSDNKKQRVFCRETYNYFLDTKKYKNTP